MWEGADVSEDFAASIFRMKKDAASSRRHNPEDLDSNLHLNAFLYS
jgi:hypothetical protein